MPDSLAAVDFPALTPEKLEALCGLWQVEEREIWITLNGGSMGPTILPGTRICLHCQNRLPGGGDIIAYRQGSLLVVHRLVQVAGSPEAPSLICLGDGNILPDEPVPATAVVGIVTAVSPIPFPQRVLFALRHPRRHIRYWLRLLRKQAE